MTAWGRFTMSTSGTMDARRNTPSNAVPNFSMEDKRDWPGNSPDLNPIENVWNWMKNKLQDSKATSLPQLQQEIKFLWTLQSGRHPVSQEPRGVHAEEAGGCSRATPPSTSQYVCTP